MNAAAGAARAALAGTLDRIRALPGVAATEAAAARVAEAIAFHQRLRGARDADLARDDEERGRAANLTGEIEAARERLSHWEAVDAAVGSPTQVLPAGHNPPASHLVR